MENQRIIDSFIDPENKTTIHRATRITGKVSGPGDMNLDGNVNGDVTIAGLLFIGQCGSVQGTITAGNMIAAGRVEGRIKIAGKIEIRASGQIQGEIICQQIAIAEGAQLDGEVHTHKGKLLTPDYFTEKRKDLRQPPK